MIKWIFLMPLGCLLDFIMGLIFPKFRNFYNDHEEQFLEDYRIWRENIQ